LSFCVDNEKGTPGKPYRGLPQAAHGNSLISLRYLIECPGAERAVASRETFFWRLFSGRGGDIVKAPENMLEKE